MGIVAEGIVNTERKKNYEAAVKYYNDKRDAFLELLTVAVKQNNEKTKEKIEKEITNVGEDQIKKGEKKAEKLLKDAVKYIFEGETMKENYKGMGNNAKNAVKGASEDAKEETKKEEIEKIRKTISEQINNKEDDFYKYLKKNKFLMKEINSGNGARTTGQIAGYLANTIFEGKTMDVKSRKYQGYIGALKGFYAEQAINDALNKTLRNIYNAANSKKFFKVVGGAGEISDLVVPLEKIAEASGVVIGTEGVEEFGLQAKPYKFNMRSGKPLAKNYHVTKNKELLNSMPEKYRPSYGDTTWYLSHYISDIIGKNNILYSVSSANLIWTGDLIKKFTESKYYLCFENEGVKETDENGKSWVVSYITTEGISWRRKPSRVNKT